MNPLLWQLRDVTLSGRAGPRLDGVSVAVPAGCCAVAGPSGAGKTSLLNLLAQFEQPAAGVIDRVSDLNATATGDEGQPSRLPVYWCPPDDGLWSHLSVREHLSMVSPDDEDDISRLLTVFDLATLANARPDSLSAGERARLSVARALASRARVLVMDEPLSHVNRSLARDCWQAIRKECGRHGMSLVFSSHDAETILRQAEHVICLKQGRVVWSGPVAELYEHPPSPELAEYLGPVNWFEPQDAAKWLNATIREPRGVRPEQIDVVPASESSVVIDRNLVIGAHTELELRDEASGRTRSLLLARGRTQLERGMRVVCSAVLSCLLVMWLSGCGTSAEGKTLAVNAARSWSLPVEGDVLPAPRAMTFSPQGELFVLDDVGRIVVYDADGKFSRSWWMPEYSAGRPEGIIVTHDGQLAIADTHYHRVVFFSQAGELLGMLGEEGEYPGQFIYPCDVTEDADGNLYVAEYGGNDRVQKFSPEHEFLLEFGEAGTQPGKFQRMGGLEWRDKTLYVCDIINNRVQTFDEQGKYLGELSPSDGTAMAYPYDLALEADGRVQVIEYKSGRLSQLMPNGEVVGRYGRTGRGAAEFWTPWGLAIAPDGRIVVADTGNRRIVELAL